MVLYHNSTCRIIMRTCNFLAEFMEQYKKKHYGQCQANIFFYNGGTVVAFYQKQAMNFHIHNLRNYEFQHLFYPSNLIFLSVGSLCPLDTRSSVKTVPGLWQREKCVVLVVSFTWVFRVIRPSRSPLGILRDEVHTRKYFCTMFKKR